MRIEPVRQSGYELFQDGAVALAAIEANGIKIDLERLAKTKRELSGKIESLRNRLHESKVWRKWKRRYGDKTKLTSHAQLAVMIYDEMGYEVANRTAHGKPSTDDEALQKIDHSFVRRFVKMMKYDKALNTFLRGIEYEIIDGRLHPSFNLHTVKTYRSSSDAPNFQNFPVRDQEIAKIIRSLFVASPGCVLVENDFKGIEVSVSACYHHDKNFISYITTPGKDMHRDMAAQVYFLKPSQVSKEARYGAKNKFVFPQFYGDFYVSCAANLWEWIGKGKLTGPDGRSLYKHLLKHGISGLGACDPESEPEEGTFERHLREVENDFWNRRFRQYGRWRQEWWRDYQRKGYFDLHTGFRISGVFRKNQVTNAPIQGSAFHCLLWTLIQFNKALSKYRMKSRIVGQIHDSLIGDVRERELKDYLELLEEIVTVRLIKTWKWLVVPLEIEYEIVPPGMTWYDKRPVLFKNGCFSHPDGSGRTTKHPSRLLASLNADNTSL